MAEQLDSQAAEVSPVTVQEFSKKVKEKYPEYKDVDDLTLAKRVVEKYPEYKDKVTFDQPDPIERETSYIPEVAAEGKQLISSIPATNPDLSIKHPEYNAPKISDSYKTQNPVMAPTVMPQGEGNQFEAIDQAQLEKEVGGAQIVQEQQSEQTGFTGKLGKTVGNSFMTGLNNLNSWVAAAPDFIYDLAGAPFRKMGLNVPMSEDFKDTPLQNISEYYKGNAKAYEQKVQQANPSRGNGVIASFEKGDIEGGILNLTGGIAESMPASIAMMLSGGATAPTILGGAAVFGAGKAQEMDENAPEMDYDKRRIISALNGTIEGIFETYLGSGAVGKSLAGIITKQGKDVAQEQAKRSLSTVFADMITKNPWLAPLGEGFEEVGTQISQNIVDKYSGYKPDIAITDGVGDSFLSGIGMGGIHGAVIGLAKKAMEERNAQPITTATIEGQQFTVNNPEDLGIEGKPIFVKDAEGNVKAVANHKATNPITQTVGELEQANQQAADQQVLMNGIADPNAQVLEEINENNIRLVKFTNGQSKIITPEGEAIANDQAEEDRILEAVINGNPLPQPKVTGEGKVINPAPERKVITQKINGSNIDIIEGEEYDEVVPSDKMPLEKALTALEKKFKDNPKFELQVEKVQVEEPGETKYDDPVKKTVVKSIKIVPKKVAEKKDLSIAPAMEINDFAQWASQNHKSPELRASAIGFMNNGVEGKLLSDEYKIYQANYRMNDDYLKRNQANEKPIEQAAEVGAATEGENTTQEVQGQGNVEGLEENVNHITNESNQTINGQGTISDSPTILDERGNNDNGNNLQGEELLPGISQLNNKAKKADIERRRQEELKIPSEKEWMDRTIGILAIYEDSRYGEWGKSTNYPDNATLLNLLDQSKKIPINLKESLGSDGIAVRSGSRYNAKEINAKYDAELTTLQNNSAVPPVVAESLTPGDSANSDQLPDAGKVIDQASIDTQELDTSIAAQKHNNAPTEKQKKTGIYDKARVNLQGFNVTLETLKGQQRSGVDSNGKPWSITMNNHYGELDGSTGYDGDPIDVFVGTNPKQGKIFVVDQVSNDGSFDESKIMLGFDTPEQAKEAYMSNYEAGWKGFSSITPVSVEEFKKWLYDGAKQRKPFAGYKGTPDPVKELTPKKTKQLSKVQTEAGRVEVAPTDVRGIVMQHFASGGILNASALEQLYGDKTAKNKKVAAERKARWTWVKNEEGMGIDELAHSLWEASSGNEMNGLSSSDFRDAIESVINDYTSPVQMAKDLIDNYNPNKPQYTNEQLEEMELLGMFDQPLDQEEIDFESQGSNIPEEYAEQLAEYYDLTAEELTELNNLFIDNETSETNTGTEKANDLNGKKPESEKGIEGKKPAEGKELTPLEKEILTLKAERSDLLKKIDKTTSQVNARNGLFGDTSAKSDDLFNGEGFNASEGQKIIDTANQRIKVIDQSIQDLTQKAKDVKATAEKENAGQRELVIPEQPQEINLSEGDNVIFTDKYGNQKEAVFTGMIGEKAGIRIVSSNTEMNVDPTRLSKSDTEERTPERFEFLTPAENFEQFESNINEILKQYSGREMGAIQMESYLLGYKDTFGKEFLLKHNVKTREDLKALSTKLQTKAREGKGKERKETIQQWEDAKTKARVEDIMDMALKAGAEMQKQIENAEEKPSYGQNNQIFTVDAAQNAREVLRRRLSGQLSVGLDPEIFMATVQLAGFHIESGARKFADFSKAMIEDIGQAIQPYLKGAYENIRRYPGMESVSKEMDETNFVDNYNFEANTIQDESTESAEDIEREAEAIARERETLELEVANVKDGQQAGEVAEKIQEVIDRIDDTLDKVKLNQAAYSTDDINHEYPNIEVGKRIKKDIQKFSKALAKALNMEHDTDRKGKADYGSANIAPAGGNASFILWVPNSEYGIYFSVPYNPDYKQGYDNYKIQGIGWSDGNPILWRVTTKKNKYQGLSNQYTKADISVGEFAEIAKKALRPYVEIKNNETKVVNNQNDSVTLDNKTVNNQPNKTNSNDQTGLRPDGSGTLQRDEAGISQADNEGEPEGVQADGGSQSGTGVELSQTLQGDHSIEHDGDQRTGEGISGPGRGIADGNTERNEREGSGRNTSNTIPSVKNSNNLAIQPGETLAPRGDNAKIKANIEAIKVAKKLYEKGQKASPAQMNILKKYTGWGGLSAVFKYDHANFKELKDLLTPEEYKSARESTTTSFYTPTDLVSQTWEMIEKLGFKGGNMLEPSSGIGHFFGLMPESLKANTNLRGIELDNISGMIASALYPDAKISIEGYEDVQLSNNSLDLVVTNVPFGQFKLFDKNEKDLSSKFNIHDFFIAKSVRKLKPGGIGVFITTTSTMDRSEALRRWLAFEGNADVIDAFRLNTETFKASSGTEASSDIIIIRKRDAAGKSEYTKDVLDAVITRQATYQAQENYRTVEKTATMYVNKFFEQNPDKMAGEMKFGFEGGNEIRPTEQRVAPAKGKNQADMLKAFTEQLPENIYEQGETATKQRAYASEDIKEGELHVIDEIPYIVKGGVSEPVDWNSNKVAGKSKTEAVKDYAKIKIAISNLIEAESSDNKNMENFRKDLNEAYDTFVSKFGTLNNNTKIGFLSDDVDFPSISAIENVEEKTELLPGATKSEKYTVTKSDIFSKRVIGGTLIDKAETTDDAIKLSRYRYGTLNIPYAAGLLDISEQDFTNTILAEEKAFENPDTGIIEPKEEYLSGNVVAKLKAAEQANEGGKFDRNINQLKTVIPTPVPLPLIKLTLGSSWIPEKVYEKFLIEQFDVRARIAKTKGGRFIAELSNEYNDKNRTKGMDGANGSDLVVNAMNNKQTVIYTTEWVDGKRVTVKDVHATMQASAKQTELSEEFEAWVKKDGQEFAEQLETVYNETFNAVIERKIDAEGFKTFPGATETKIPRTHQKEGVLRSLERATMLAHEVGTGKTITLISTAMEMRRLGLAKKPVIVVQRSTYRQFVNEIKSLYPGAKVLVPSAKDLTGSQREQLLAKIAYNDWDIVVLYHSYLDAIPDDPTRVASFIQEQIDEKMEMLDELKGSGAKGSGYLAAAIKKQIEGLVTDRNVAASESIQAAERKQASIKQQEKTKKNAETKAKTLVDRRTDNVMYFEQLGVDALLIDEAHAYKKLGFNTNLQGVKGVDQTASKRAQSLRLKSRFILDNHNGKNIVLATGTPISNTMAEMWTFLRYLLPKEELERLQMNNFDQFVNNFGEIEESAEFSTSGKFKVTNRFSKYANIPELQAIWKQVAHTVLTEEVSTLKAGVGTPNLAGDKPTDTFLPQTNVLKAVMRSVKAEIERFEKMSGKEKKENSHIPLVQFGLAKQAAIDVRLVNSSLNDDPGSKLNETVRITLKQLEQTKDYNGTIAIFCDSYQSRDRRFNVFEDVKKKLVAQGVPEGQIAIINDYNTDDKKEGLFKKVNAGQVRVVMGTTERLGVGVNIQERLNTLVHMDAPIRPSDYQQRNGRILRQGNLHLQMGIPVNVIRVGVEKTLDVTGYQRLKIKEDFIKQIMKSDNDPSKRDIAEVEVDNVDASNFSHMMASLSGSQSALALTIEQNKLRKLRNAEEYHRSNQGFISKKIHELKRDIPAYDVKIEKEQDFKAWMQTEFKADHVTRLKIGRSETNKPEEFEALLLGIKKQIEEKKTALRASQVDMSSTISTPILVNGVKTVLKTDLKKEFNNTNNTVRVYTYNTISDLSGNIEVIVGPDVESIIDKFNSQLSGKSIDSYIEMLGRKKQADIKSLAFYQGEVGKPFDKADQLLKSEAEIERLNVSIREELAAIEAQEAADNIEAADLGGADELEEDETRFQIIGEQGAANIEGLVNNLTIAKQMTEAGKDAKTIFLATGWEKFQDGWKYDLPDGDLITKNPGWGRNQLKNIISSPELFKAYPELEDIKILPAAVGDSFQGSYDSETNTITINDKLNGEAYKSILLHEAQHAIQEKEGFAQGGNLKTSYQDLEDQRVSLIRKRSELMKEAGFIKNPEYIRLNGEIKNVIEKLWGYENPDSNKSFEEYQRLAGEVEARNVQERLNLTSEQRREQMLSETQDVAEEQKIYLQGAIDKAYSIETTGESVEDGENTIISSTASTDLSNRPNVVKALTKISDELGEPVHIINSSEIPSQVGELKKQITKGNRVPAFFYNGKIYLISDQVTSVSDALKSYLHELIVHKGLREVFSGANPVSIIGKQYAKFNDLMVDVFGSMTRTQKIAIASSYAPNLYNQNGKIMYTPTKEEKALIGEEFLAHISENSDIYDAPTLSKWQQFINRLLQIIRKAFRLTSNQFTQSDLLDIVRESRERIKAKAEGNNNTILIDGVKRSKVNSKGQPIAETEEGIRNFYRWFVDSKVVDGEGRPLVVYHGAMGSMMPKGTFKGYVTYFTDSKQYAETFGFPIDRETMEAYIRIEKPYKAPSEMADVPEEVHYTDQYTNPRIIKSENGKYDGVIGVDAGQKQGKTYAVFSPSQIKSATGNDGSFNPQSNDIRFQVVQDELNAITSLPRTQLSDLLKSVNETVEANMTEAHGIKATPLWERIKAKLTEIKESAQHFKHITESEFPVVYDKLRQFEAIPDRVKKEAYERMGEIIRPISKNKQHFEAFERYIVLQDLVHDIEEDGLFANKELPWGYNTTDEIKTDMRNVRTYVMRNPTVLKAIRDRQAMMKEVKDALVDNKLLKDNGNDKYFHHQVLAYMEGQVFPGVSSKDVRNNRKGWQRSRVGSIQAYNTNYIESEFEVLAQSLEQVAIKTMLGEIGSKINIMADLIKQAENEGGKWRDYIPEGYKYWFPKQGTNAYKAASMAEKAVQNILKDPNSPDVAEQIAEVEGSMWVIPEPIARQLDEMKDREKEMVFPAALRVLTGKWKQWILLNPYSAIKYNFNNMSGDIDVVMAYNPAILKAKYAKAATTEAWNELRGKGMSEDMKEALKYGIITSGLSIQEIPDVNQQTLFRAVAKGTGQNIAQKLWGATGGKYWNSITDLSQFRENMLRLAAYKFFKEQIEAGKTPFGASNHKAIQALYDEDTNPKEIAAKLARELLGDYGNLSQAGQWLRAHSYPFWSWVEINTPRYYRMLKNTKFEDNTGAIGRIAGVGAKKTAFNIGKLAVKATLLMGLVVLWNRTFWPDEDDELAKQKDQKLKLIVGRREDGSIMTMKVQGAFSDMLSYFGLEDGVNDVEQIREGKKTAGKMAAEAGSAFLNKFTQGAMPLTKTMAEMITKKSFYPDILNPRPVRDRAEQGLRIFKMDKIYNYLTHKPARAFGKEVTGLLVYDNSPGEAAYFTMRQNIFDYMKDNGEEFTSGEPTERSNALYYYKQSLKFGDTEKASFWFEKYKELGGTGKGYQMSMQKGKVENTIPNDMKAAWYQSLDAEDKEILEMANKWYYETYLKVGVPKKGAE